MGNCLNKEKSDAGEDDDKYNLYRGNVCVITSKEGWMRRSPKPTGRIRCAAWCGPCRVIAPLYSELSEKFPSLLFLTIDVDDLTEFSSAWDIRATPTFFFLKKGKQIDKLVGANKPELERKIALHADSPAVG